MTAIGGCKSTVLYIEYNTNSYYSVLHENSRCPRVPAQKCRLWGNLLKLDTVPVEWHHSFMSNPFQQTGQGEKACPFIGGFPVPVQTGKILHGQERVEIQITLTPCAKEGCTFWNKEEAECQILIGMKALPSLVEQMGPLATMFGNK